MTLVEVVCATLLSSFIALAVGYTVTLMARGTTDLERRGQVQAEATLALTRIRSELNGAMAFQGISNSQISFVHPSSVGDGPPSLITYAWSGPGSPLTRRVDTGTAENLIDQCQICGFSSLSNTSSSALQEELIAGHLLYPPDTASSPQMLNVSSTNWISQGFTPTRTGAARCTITRVRALIQPLSTNGALTMTLRPVSNYAPTSTILDTAARTLNTALKGSLSWEDFFFSANTSLTAGNYYAVVLEGNATTAQATAVYDFISGGTAPLTGDWCRWTTNAGGSWSPSGNLSLRDLYFMVYGRFYNSAGSPLPINTGPVDAVVIEIIAGSSDATARVQTTVQCINRPEVLQ